MCLTSEKKRKIRILEHWSTCHNAHVMTREPTMHIIIKA